jgi:hypothetical protein
MSHVCGTPHRFARALSVESKKICNRFLFHSVNRCERGARFLAVNKKGIADRRRETYLWVIKLRSKLGDFGGYGAGAQDYG